MKHKERGPEQVTQLPDQVTAERRCQNAAEEEKNMHTGQKTRERTKRDKEGKREERSVQKLAKNQTTVLNK